MAGLLPTLDVQATPNLDLAGTSGVAVVKLSASDHHTVALKADGTVWTWGGSSYGSMEELGYDGDGSYAAKVQLPATDPDTGASLGSVVDIAAGGEHTAVLFANHTVWVWGDNSYNQLGVPYTSLGKSVTPVKVYKPTGAPLTDIVEISAGGSYTLALDTAGSVWAWGSNEKGQLGQGDTSGIAYAQQVMVPGSSGNEPITGIQHISAGQQHALALTVTGSVYAWGSDRVGQLGMYGYATNRTLAYPVTGLSDVAMIRTGSTSESSFAVTVSGAVYGWGENYSGQLGTNEQGFDARKTSPTPLTIPGGPQVKDIAVSGYHTLVLLADGRVMATGSNSNGQLATNAFGSSVLQFSDVGLNGVKGIAAGYYTSFFLKDDLKLYASGKNDYNETGVGYTPNTNVIVPMLVGTSPYNLRFTDEDNVEYRVAGDVEWEQPFQTPAAAKYDIYFVDAAGTPIPETGLALQVPVSYNSYYMNEMLDDARVGAFGIRIFVNGTPTAAWTPVFDDPMQRPSLYVYDRNGEAGSITPMATWLAPAWGEGGIMQYRLRLKSYTGSLMELGTFPAGYTPFVYASPSDFATVRGAELQLAIEDYYGHVSTYVSVPLADNIGTVMTMPSLNSAASMPSDVTKSPGVTATGEIISWSPVENEASIAGYRVYGLSDTMDRVLPLGFVPKGAGNRYILPPGTTFPASVQYIGVASVTVTDQDGPFTGQNTLSFNPRAATGMYFLDKDLDAGELRGTVQWMKAMDETDTVAYAVYFLDSTNHPIGDALGVVAVGDLTQLTIGPNTPIPSGAVKLGISSMTGDSFNMEDPLATLLLEDTNPEDDSAYADYLRAAIMELDPYTGGVHLSGILRLLQSGSEPSVERVDLEYMLQQIDPLGGMPDIDLLQ
jgi:alpha-tubulin suppressor-like RCC1 family protein